LITDVLEFRLHPYAIIGTAVHLGGRFLMPKALTTDIRALFSDHGFEIVRCGIGPRQQVVDLAIWMIVDDLGEDV
jgi:hypothetical protein